MHILYCHQYFNTPDTPGSLRSYEISKSLIKKGHSVSIITSYGNSKKFNLYKKKKITYKEIDGIKVYFIDSKFSNLNHFSKILSFIYFSLICSLRVLTIKADLIYVTSTPLTIVIPALLKKLVSNTPFIFEVRDLWPDVPIKIKVLKNFFLIKLALYLEYLAYKHAKKIVVIVDGFKNYLVKNKNINSKKIITIYQFCYDTSINPKKSKKIIFKKNKSYLLYAGGIDFSHNVEYLVYLAEKIYLQNKNIVFLICGHGNHFSKVYLLAKKLNVLNKNLFFLGNIKREELLFVSKYSKAHIALANPNLPKFHLKNNANNKFFFAINCNKPILNNFTSWQTKISTKNNIGIKIDSFNFDIASNEIIKFLKNIRFYSNIKNFNKLKKKFSLERQMKILENNLLI